MTGRHAERRSAIEAALLDFQRAPGRQMLGLRQPALLFASIREILQYAGERTPDDDASPPPVAVVEAARFFVRSALLKPDADHYALLGLTREADAAAIKERYRSLMRLTHPDFRTSPGGASWPADAATRINQAYEVLSSHERRRAYDEANEPPAPQPASLETNPAKPQNVTPASHRGHSRQILRHLAMGFGAIAALAVVALWAATVSGDRDSLVQRATTHVVADKLPSLFAQATSPATPAPAEDDVLQAAVARALPAILATPVAAAPPAPPASAASSIALVVRVEAAQVETPPARVEVNAEPVAAPAPSSPAAVTPAAAVAPSAPAAAPALVASPVASKTVVVAQAPPVPSRPAPAGPSMADVHPLVTRLLSDIESGWGDNLIASLDFSTRRSADAQSLARQLDALCDGARPVKITKVDLRGEPRDGKLVVIGQVVLQVRDPSTPTRRFALQADFMQQGGTPVLTRLAPVTSQ